MGASLRVLLALQTEVTMSKSEDVLFPSVTKDRLSGTLVYVGHAGQRLRWRTTDLQCPRSYPSSVPPTKRYAAIVLGHGLGAIKEMGLQNYSQKFAEEGYLCLMFDYRHFGHSEGQPRQLLEISKQLEDWKSAVAYIRSRPDVDPEQVAIFGSSFWI